MPRPSDRHDPDRFYHCSCKEEDPEGEHDKERFYHCDCLEGGYTPPDSQQAGKSPDPK